MKKLNTILEVFFYLVIIRHIIALFTSIPQVGLAISGYGSMSALAWNFVMHIAMIVILVNLLKIKKLALYLFGGIQLINIAFQSLFFGRDFLELTIVATILCALMAVLLCLRKDGISAWQLFFPKEEPTSKDNQDIEFEILQEEDASNDKNISTENLEDKINTSETINDDIEDLTIDTLPQKEDGSLDYEKMTPIQQFAYTCKTESVEVALKDLNADIKALEKSIGKVKKELSSLSGGNRAKLRDALREDQRKLDELYELRKRFTIKKKWNLKIGIIFIAIICSLLCLIYYLSMNNEIEEEIEPVKKAEVVNNIQTVGQYVDPKEKLYSFINEEGYDNFTSLEEFMNYIKDVHNRKKIVNALKIEGYDNFTNQLELDTYLGYESVYYTYYNNGEKYDIPIAVADDFERDNPSALIEIVNKGNIKMIFISEKNDIKLNDKEIRPHLMIKIPKNYIESKRRLLYYSLLATRYLSNEEIGTMSEFIKALSDKKKLKEFYWNLRNWGLLSSEIGSETDFCNNWGAEFETSHSDKRKILYNHLFQKYNLGDYESFSRKLDDEKKRRAFYDAVSKDYDLGDYETFCKKISR